MNSIVNEKMAFKIAKYRRQGVGATEIAKKLKITKFTAQNWVNRFIEAGMKMPKFKVGAASVIAKIKIQHKDWFSGS